MSWHLQYLKYKHLASELVSTQSEYDMTSEIIKIAGVEFAEYKNSWAAHNQVDLSINSQEQYVQFEAQVKERSVSSTKNKKLAKTAKKSSKIFSRIYKLIAKKIHPDKFASFEHTPEIEEKKEMYKKAASGMSFNKWADVLEVALELGVKPTNLTEINTQIQIEIQNIKDLISFSKTTYGWKFYECQDDYACKDKVVRSCIESFYKK